MCGGGGGGEGSTIRIILHCYQQNDPSISFSVRRAENHFCVSRLARGKSAKRCHNKYVNMVLNVHRNHKAY